MNGIASWSAIWHPAYRRDLRRLGLLAAAMGLLVYAENVALGAFSKSFAVGGAADSTLMRRLSAASTELGIAPPLLVLGTFTVMRVLRIAVDVTSRRYSAMLNNRGRNDLERITLDHLLRKDDTFFLSRPPAEILNRLSTDIGRVVERRTLTLSRWQSILLIVGNIYFFLREDWRLALAGVAICALGAWTMHRLTHPVKEMDRAYMQNDDKVKSTFEDFLKAAPEIQVGHLGRDVETRFAAAQVDRRTTFLRFTGLNAWVNIASSLSYLLAFLSLTTIPMFLFQHADASVELALIPVVLKALPDLFAQASQLVFQRLTLQMAETSCKRLLEYDAGGEPPARESIVLAERANLVIEGVTYRYRSNDGAMVGGVSEVTTSFEAGQWTAIVGAAGSGKSTLLQLVVGRVSPQAGAVRFGDASYADLGAAARARVLTLMPQTPAILDATIEENLLFGCVGSEVDIALVEMTGLGSICRKKALGMQPVETPGRGLPGAIADVRSAVRARLAAAGISVTHYESGGRDADDSVIERLARVRANRARLVDCLLDVRARPLLNALATSELGRALLARVPAMLEETRALLALPTFHDYAKLAKFPVDERMWQKRVASLNGTAHVRDRLVVALGARVAELGDVPVGDAASFSAILGESALPLDAGSTHPFLTWLDNVIFGVVEAENSRVGGRVEEVVLDTLAELGLEVPLAAIGLSFSVGRNGGRLSGGQRQLVALTRALLRRTPILVLDEPTSALDPNSRARVAALLREWSKERVVLTVTHDPELAREADELRVLGGGRIIASGSFADLEASSAAFREVLKLR